MSNKTLKTIKGIVMLGGLALQGVSLYLDNKSNEAVYREKAEKYSEKRMKELAKEVFEQETNKLEIVED